MINRKLGVVFFWRLSATAKMSFAINGNMCQLGYGRMERSLECWIVSICLGWGGLSRCRLKFIYSIGQLAVSIPTLICEIYRRNVPQLLKQSMSQSVTHCFVLPVWRENATPISAKCLDANRSAEIVLFDLTIWFHVWKSGRGAKLCSRGELTTGLIATHISNLYNYLY